MSSVIDSIERDQRRKGLPSFAPGDRVRVHFQVVEGSRRRTQVFEGIVLKRQGSGVRETFTVRKQSFGVGVERTFPLHSPKIEKLEIAARGDVRRAKLYYLRGRIGKAARVAERRWGIDEELITTPVSADSEKPQAVDAEGVTVGEAEAEEAPEDASAAAEASDEQSAQAEAAAEDAEQAPEDAEKLAEDAEKLAEDAEKLAEATEEPEAKADEAPAAETEKQEAGETEDAAPEAEAEPDAEDSA